MGNIYRDICGSVLWSMFLLIGGAALQGTLAGGF